MSYLVIGGNSGLGMAIANKLAQSNRVIVCGIGEPITEIQNIDFFHLDLFKDDIKKLQPYINQADAIIYTAGIGRVDFLNNLSETEIDKNIKINLVGLMKVVSMAYSKLKSNVDFKFMCISSIAGLVSSPLFSVYAASKGGICRFAESVNSELRMQGSQNVITNIVATSFTGTSFNGGKTNLDALREVADELINAMNNKEEVHYVNHELIESIIERYQKNPKKYADESYIYKMDNNRINRNKQYKIGYLSGTFDLFHIGHLNLLRRAKEKCDYLVVGVHKDASHKGKETFISFDERKQIVESIKYVDEVIESTREDSDAWDICHYDYLFVGSDYKGTERFNRYEEYFKDKGVKINYFPYSDGTSSTQLRNALDLMK